MRYWLKSVPLDDPGFLWFRDLNNDGTTKESTADSYNYKVR